jgi:hypothetical protein
LVLVIWSEGRGRGTGLVWWIGGREERRTASDARECWTGESRAGPLGGLRFGAGRGRG